MPLQEIILYILVLNKHSRSQIYKKNIFYLRGVSIFLFQFIVYARNKYVNTKNLYNKRNYFPIKFRKTKIVICSAYLIVLQIKEWETKIKEKQTKIFQNNISWRWGSEKKCSFFIWTNFVKIICYQVKSKKLWTVSLIFKFNFFFLNNKWTSQ